MKEVFLSTYTETKLKKYRQKARNALIFDAAFITTGLIAGTIVNPLLYALVPIGIAIALAGRATRRLCAVYGAGAEGEARLRERLRQILGPQYTAFWGVPVANGDIDCVIVGPATIWAIECKCLSGDISYRFGKWSRVRRRGNEVYAEEIRSPSAQLNRAVRHLKAHMAARGISNIWLEEMIVFVAKGCNLTVDGLQHVTATKLLDLKAPVAGRRLSAERRRSIEETLLGLGCQAETRQRRAA